nr:g2/mitotic-specific cyclin-4 [Quercus suber]
MLCEPSLPTIARFSLRHLGCHGRRRRVGGIRMTSTISFGLGCFVGLGGTANQILYLTIILCTVRWDGAEQSGSLVPEDTQRRRRHQETLEMRAGGVAYCARPSWQPLGMEAWSDGTRGPVRRRPAPASVSTSASTRNSYRTLLWAAVGCVVPGGKQQPGPLSGTAAAVVRLLGVKKHPAALHTHCCSTAYPHVNISIPQQRYIPAIRRGSASIPRRCAPFAARRHLGLHLDDDDLFAAGSSSRARPPPQPHRQRPHQQYAARASFSDMDARPQRPRVLRVNDENMAPPALTANGHLTGKTLHQRTKSVPAFSSILPGGVKAAAAAKKVLGEVNANTKFLRRATDDSEIQKASPGKIVLVKDVPVVTAHFTRPASRPLVAKPAPVIVANKEPVQKMVPDAASWVVAKKSTRVLRDVQPSQQPEESKKPTVQAPSQQAPTLSAKPTAEELPLLSQQVTAVAAASLRPEVCKTDSGHLRDVQGLGPAPLPAPQVGPVHYGFQSEQEYVGYVADTANVQQQQQQGMIKAHIAPVVPPQVEHYYDAPEEEYSYGEATGYTTARSLGLQGESTGGMTTCLAPKVTEKSKLEIAEAKRLTEALRAPEDVEDELWDTSMVAEYGDEIFEYMRQLETKMTPNPFYMDKQTEIQWSMRAVLMDWIVQVHQRFNLLPETLFLTANYIDRFLSAKIVSLGKLQLVGATAIFVAAKYEEVQCPTIQEIIYMVDGGYSADELLKAERFMLSMLQYELGWPGPMSFLRRISKADDYCLETRTLAKYFLEITLMDERFVGATPSWLAAGAHCIARLMLRKGEWTPAHVYYSNFTYAQLRPLIATILECCEDPCKHHGAVFDKYTDKRYKRASTFVAAEISKGYKLPPVPVALSSSSTKGPLDAAAATATVGGRLLW